MPMPVYAVTYVCADVRIDRTKVTIGYSECDHYANNSRIFRVCKSLSINGRPSLIFA